jgi:outer membrane lipoprotein-sorting protein
MWKISAKVAAVLDSFSSNALSFRQAKEALQGIMQQVGTIVYKEPSPRRIAVAR